MYTFNTFDFSSKEIDQIVTLMTNWVKGVKPDLRKLTAQVKRYARMYSLIENSKVSPVFVYSRYIDPKNDLPTEALYRMVLPMIKVSQGFSITKDRNWTNLNITANRDLVEMETILLKLDMEGFITFQSAGNLWRIDLK